MSSSPGKPATHLRVAAPTNTSNAVVGPSALIAAGAGLLWQAGDSPYSFMTLRGQTAEIYGRGLYRYDTLFFGAGYKGQDAVVRFLSIPLLYRRSLLRGALLHVGTLAYFLYTYASMALGATYNELFLLYIAPSRSASTPSCWRSRR